MFRDKKGEKLVKPPGSINGQQFVLDTCEAGSGVLMSCTFGSSLSIVQLIEHLFTALAVGGALATLFQPRRDSFNKPPAPFVVESCVETLIIKRRERASRSSV